MHVAYSPLGIILLVILILLLVGALPRWWGPTGGPGPTWGYYPVGIFGLLIVILIILLIFGLL